MMEGNEKSPIGILIDPAPCKPPCTKSIKNDKTEFYQNVLPFLLYPDIHHIVMAAEETRFRQFPDIAARIKEYDKLSYINQ